MTLVMGGCQYNIALRSDVVQPENLRHRGSADGGGKTPDRLQSWQDASMAECGSAKDPKRMEKAVWNL